MPFTFHCHSGQFCHHATGTLEEVVVSAIQKNIKVLGISEHVPRFRFQDLYPEEVEKNITPGDLLKSFENYILEARRLQDKYCDKIKLLVGMETEWISNTENCNKHKCPKYTGSTALGGEQLVALRNHCKIDYVVGSLHHVKGIPIDFSVELYKQAIEAHDNDINKLFDAYYDEQYQMLVTVKPEIIGHFDLIRIFSHCIDGDTSENGVNSGVSYTLGSQTMQRIVRNIKYGIEIGALFEINSRAYKKGHEFAYPHPDILKIILDNGGKVTISDDSHSPSEIGLFYSKLFQYLKDMNISQIHYLDRDESTGVVKTLICDNILDESLWHHFHS